MSCAHEYDREANLIVVKFWGAVSNADALGAVAQVLGAGGVDPDPRVLADLREASIASSAAELRTQVDALGPFLDAAGMPRVAILVATDLDFGLARMFEIDAQGQLRHKVAVFRELSDAADWLGRSLPRDLFPRRPREATSELSPSAGS